MKTDIRSLSYEELENRLLSMGEERFRARQIYGWLHKKLASGYDEMLNVPKSLREALKEQYSFQPLEIVDMKESKIDGTRKYLFCLEDGNMIESMWMQYRHGNTVCISSQAGCRMGCRFCASGIGGLMRNLTAAEMLDQVCRIQVQTGERVSNIVVMGSGEPLDNYEETIRFLHRASDKDGLHISQRSITISTCGIVPGIRRLAKEGLQVTLALSLHAPNDRLRKELMPIAARYPLPEVLAACREYFEATGRRLTFEYSLIRGVNDSLEQARQLAVLIKDMHGHVNLIPINPVKERRYMQPRCQNIMAFKACLEKNGIAVTIRREMGRDIDGACGQLRRSFLLRENPGPNILRNGTDS